MTGSWDELEIAAKSVRTSQLERVGLDLKAKSWQPTAGDEPITFLKGLPAGQFETSHLLNFLELCEPSTILDLIAAARDKRGTDNNNTARNLIENPQYEANKLNEIS